MRRTLVKIDADKCNGCGECITGCHEGALQLINGKAVLVREDYCDGLGACIGDCPVGAITLEEREGAAFVMAPPQTKTFHATHSATSAMHAIPSGQSIPNSPQPSAATGSAAFSAGRLTAVPRQSCFTQWPVQLRLINPLSETFRDAHLLLAADCSAFAGGAAYQSLLQGKALAIACPKLDSDPAGYIEKLATMISQGNLQSITVLLMEVPCCRGLLGMVTKAVELSGQSVPVRQVVMTTKGEIGMVNG
ncbi:MAG: ATP-binding protein [Bacteroidales bacterium]